MANEAAELRRRLRLACRQAVTVIGEDLLGEAQRRAPIEEGTLRGSGELEIDDDALGVTATVSFNEVYAARQHEELDWHHPLGGQPKYLESVLLERLPRYEAVLAAAIRRVL